VLGLMCDWRVIVDDRAVRIGLNETQLGIAVAVVIEPLRAQVPAASLVPIALEGRLFAPVEALAVGLVHVMVPAAEVLAHAIARAKTLAELPPGATAQVKHALRGPVIDAISRTSAVETERWLDSWFAPEAQARLRAAVAKLARA
jgi:enoyl-CoA hydratase/carnithine racemase